MLKAISAAAAAAFIASASPACAAEPAKAHPALDPLEFFTGELRSEGTLKVMMKAATRTRSDTRGTPDGKGGMTLEQKVFEGGKLARIRRWALYPTSKSTLAGTMTDAAGPIVGELRGNRLHLRFRMKDGLAAEQYLYLQPDRRTLLNRMTVRKWGVVVARIEETIRKLP